MGWGENLHPVNLTLAWYFAVIREVRVEMIGNKLPNVRKQQLNVLDKEEVNPTNKFPAQDIVEITESNRDNSLNENSLLIYKASQPFNADSQRRDKVISKEKLPPLVVRDSDKKHDSGLGGINVVSNGKLADACYPKNGSVHISMGSANKVGQKGLIPVIPKPSQRPLLNSNVVVTNDNTNNIDTQLVRSESVSPK